jgi:hypothetical protein
VHFSGTFPCYPLFGLLQWDNIQLGEKHSSTQCWALDTTYLVQIELIINLSIFINKSHVASDVVVPIQIIDNYIPRNMLDAFQR